MKPGTWLKTSLLSLTTLTFAGMLSGCGQAVFPNNTTGTAATNTSQNGKANSASTTGAKKSGAATPTAPVWPTVHFTALHTLPVDMLGDALAIDPAGNPVISGGYTGAYSLTGVVRINPTGAPVVLANLPQPTHDAAAGYIGSALYVFGGGQNASYNSITKVSHGQVSSAGTLPDYLSDATAVPYRWQGQSGLLIVGGYNGQAFNRTVRFASVGSSGLTLRDVFTMPVGLRYIAATALGNSVAYAGGLTTSGSITNTVYLWSPSHGVQLIAHLPHALQKAAAFHVGSRYLLVAGGLLANGQPSTTIYGIDLVTKQVKVIGQLPSPLADMGYAQSGNTGYITGGEPTASYTQATNAAWKLSL